MSEEAASQKESSPTPVFGSASTFGKGSGFAGFTGAAPANQKSEEPVEKADAEEAADEEDCSAEFKPVVQLQEVETVSGEEAEASLADFKCKLYRFDNDSGEWKERGAGQVKLLENKENQRIRLLMRQEKTLKIRANHILMPGTKLQVHSGSEKAWVWSAVDFADEEQKPELFCLRLANAERAQEFKKLFDSAVEKNTKTLGSLLEEAPDSAAEAKKEEDASLAKEIEQKAAITDSKEAT